MIEDVIKVLKQHKNGDIQTPTAMGQIFALFGVSGSTSEPIGYCPKCKSNDIRQYTKTTDKCNNCNHAWYVYEPFKGVE